jgi:DNA-binding IclR family transcriptional regulator
VSTTGCQGTTAAAEERPGSQSARRVLRLLLAFDEGAHTHSARQLAAIAGLPLPTAHRYVALLRDEGLLVEAGPGTYRLSPRIFALARAAQAAEPLVSLADPIMRKLSAETGETVLLVEVLWDATVCAHRVESTQRLRLSYQPGHALSLTHGASAKVLLGGLPTQQRERHLAEVEPARRLRFRAEVEAAQRDGWATSEEEIDQGIWAAAAAVEDRRGVVAALSVPCPLPRARDEARREAIVARVRAAAGELSEVLRIRSWGVPQAQGADR